jgi:hypothetical protein
VTWSGLQGIGFTRAFDAEIPMDKKKRRRKEEEEEEEEEEGINKFVLHL